MRRFLGSLLCRVGHHQPCLSYVNVTGAKLSWVNTMCHRCRRWVEVKL